MSKEQIIFVLGEDTPEEVKKEVEIFKRTAIMSFDWDDEDNESMPVLANYLEEKYRLYRCLIV